MASTAFYSDERCFWHSGGNYASVVPVGGLVQPLAAGGLPENPETKRRLKNLLEVTGLAGELDCLTAAPATEEQLRHVHPASYLSEFKRMSDAGGGELGQRTPFGPGGYEIATLSAGLVSGALQSVLRGQHRNAYALSRPPGHHCLPETPMGFCLLANIAVAIETARAAGLAERFAVVDWDVHHGNGTEAVFINRPDVLTISLHQENNYPRDTGGVAERGQGAGEGANINIPLPPGSGHSTYIRAFDKIVEPALRNYRPDVIIIACGFDGSGVDPLSRMLMTSSTFAGMTRRVKAIADAECGGRLVMAHEGGYSEVHVPFCGHAVIQAMAGSDIAAPDPLEDRIMAHQPTARFQAFLDGLVDELADTLVD